MARGPTISEQFIDSSYQIVEEIRQLRTEIKEGMLRQQATDIKLTELQANFNNLLPQINNQRRWLFVVTAGIAITIAESLLFYIYTQM